MNGLLNGADCAAPANPLNNVLKREGVDNSLFRDRMAGPSAGPSSQAFRSAGAGPSQAHPGLASRPAQPFNLSNLAQALAQPPQQQAQPDFRGVWDRHQSASPSPGPQQFAQPPQAQMNNGWATDFHTGKGKGRAAPPPMQQQPVYEPQQSYAPMYGGMGGGMGMGMYQSRLQPMYGAQAQQGPVAGPAAQIHHGPEMDAAFEAALADAQAQADAAREAEKEPEQEAVHPPPQVEDETDGIEDSDQFKGDLDAVWESLKPEAERLNKLAEWEKEFSQFVDGEDDTLDILNADLARSDIGHTGLDEQLEFGTGRWLDGGEAENGLPAPVDYHFTHPNKFETTHQPVAAWLEATRTLASGGSLSDGALLLETFLERATQADIDLLGISRAQAWAILGRTQAENEMEDKALAAFEQGRKEINDDPASKRAAAELLTNLAISYVNESLDLAALTTLHQLLTTLHPTHAGAAPSRAEFVASDNPWALHQRMTDQFLALAREQYANAGHVDPDVQVGLGTLYYMMGEFGEARSCWVAALGERPDDYLLWNRLGATLANGGEPEQAVDAYRRALEIKPTFTRAIANLGVACLNIGVHREAAEHFLAALAMQPTDPMGVAAPEAYSLWSTLRRALIALDMPELAEQARPGTDLNVFRQAGFEF
ncbi:Peroxisomal targeting signal receptor [Vanrija pseudolonga]|uniref:Peroxisomal targeting signal receptor n=1 Tax=Vanrija pseudolonga TaxID=143232 RepID=A0AAF0Y9F2_9TREE|nr:Peroxisomal targeting signal receptor [Vanrija pseudolonga]